MWFTYHQNLVTIQKKKQNLFTIQYDSKYNIGLIIGGIIKKPERKTKKKCGWTWNLHYSDHKTPISCSKFQSQLPHLTRRYCIFRKHASFPYKGVDPTPPCEDAWFQNMLNFLPPHRLWFIFLSNYVVKCNCYLVNHILPQTVV